MLMLVQDTLTGGFKPGYNELEKNGTHAWSMYCFVGRELR